MNICLYIMYVDIINIIFSLIFDNCEKQLHQLSVDNNMNQVQRGENKVAEHDGSCSVPSCVTMIPWMVAKSCTSW